MKRGLWLILALILSGCAGCAGWEDYFLDETYDYGEGQAAQPAPFTQSAPPTPQQTREPELLPGP